MVSQWQEELQNETKVKLTTLTTVIKAFNAAMIRVTSEDGSSKGVEAMFRVEGNHSFFLFIYIMYIDKVNVSLFVLYTLKTTGLILLLFE